MQREPAEMSQTDLSSILMERLAVDAWLGLNGGHREPRATTRIKPRKDGKRGKTFAFRLEGATANDESVIAKLTAPSTAILERHVYDGLLSQLGAPAPTCYGVADEVRSGQSWIFIEEIQGPRPSRENVGHLRVLGAWLGIVAEGAQALRANLRLPKRDVGFIRSELQAAHARVAAATSAGEVGSDSVRLLNRLARACDTLLVRWDYVDRAAQSWPTTIVHGDLTPKNIRLRNGGPGVIPYAFDWEHAGWGNPAIDLAGLVGGAPGSNSAPAAEMLATYAKFATVFWPEVTSAEVGRCLEYGRLLRLVHSIIWATARLKPGFERSKSGRQLEWFTPWLEEACESPLVAAGGSSGSGRQTSVPLDAFTVVSASSGTDNEQRGGWRDVAVDLWLSLDRTNRRPASAEALQEDKGRSVYRFFGVGHGESNIIAKRCRIDEAEREAFVYEDILPFLPLPAIALHGYVPNWQGSGWLFMDDAGTDILNPEREEDRDLAGRWLATLHTSSALVFSISAGAGSSGAGEPGSLGSKRLCLRDRGPAFHRGELLSALEALVAASSSPVLSDSDSTLVHELLTRLEGLSDQWTSIEDQYSGSPIPETLVHGDFKEVHLCHQQTSEGPSLVAIDWNEAGWGRPAIDLAKFLDYPIRPSLLPYLDVARDYWPDVDAEAIRQLGLVGEVFRAVAAIRWASERLLRPWIGSPISKLRYHLDWLDRSLVELGLQR
jgi:aminoglycoside phosphotransferase (APT) family kinase protein